MIGKEVNPYATHVPILEHILNNFDVENTLEFGMGDFSTKLLLEKCEKVFSIEMQDRSWYEHVKNEFKNEKFFPYSFVHPFSGIDFAETLTNRFDLIFVDGHGKSRWQQINFAFKKTNLIVAHDTEAKIYKWYNVALPEHWQWMDITDYSPWTAVITNRKDVISSIRDNFTTQIVEDMHQKIHLNDYEED